MKVEFTDEFTNKDKCQEENLTWCFRDYLSERSNSEVKIYDEEEFRKEWCPNCKKIIT